MINLKNAIKEFQKYTGIYNQKDKEIKLKIYHTYRVMKISKSICKNLNLSLEETKLAALIALLHDLGRFEQLKKYNTFIDAHSMDHAKYAVQILFKEKQVRKYIDDDKYDGIIAKAIFNHNKKELDTTDMNEQEILHSKIIRDADKTDIFIMYCRKPMNELISKSTKRELEITDKIYSEFFNKKALDHNDVETIVDAIIFVIAFMFDINFKITNLRIKNKKYVDRIINRIKYKDSKTIEKMEEVKKTIKKHIETKLAK